MRHTFSPARAVARGRAPDPDASSFTYVLVMDCRALGPHHFGKAARRCAGRLGPIMAEYYPNQIESTQAQQ